MELIREEEKREAARRYATHDVDTDETDFYGNYVKKEDFVLPEYNAFIEGCKWSDANPKCPWISVKEDLPCNHKELLLDNGLATKKVFVLINATTPALVPMVKFSKWDWILANVTHWFAIPELPKE